MPIELLARPVVEALLKALDRAKDSRLRSGARKALGEAISELIRIDPDLTQAEAKIAVARAAGILDKDLFTAESMLKKVKKAQKRRDGVRGPKKTPATRRRKKATARPKSR